MENRIRNQLAVLQNELQRLELWTAHPPEAACFESEMPFFIDTMELNQWLQWVFLPRMLALLEGNHPLPQKSAISEYAEVWAGESAIETGELVLILKRLDELMCGDG